MSERNDVPKDIRDRAAQIGWDWFGRGHHDAAALTEDILKLIEVDRAARNGSLCEGRND